MNRLKYIILGLVLGSTIVFGRTIVDTILKLGNGTDVDIKLEAELGKGVANPALNYDSTNDKWQFCNEGDACADMGSGGGGGGGVPLLGKGSLLTSDGVTNGEFTACANDELIVWDSAEVGGFKCEAKPAIPICADNEILVYDSVEVLGYRCEPEPSGGGAPLYEVFAGGTNYSVGGTSNTGIVTLPLTAFSISFTAVSSKPITITPTGFFRIATNTSNTQIECSLLITRTPSGGVGVASPVIANRDSVAAVVEIDAAMPTVIDDNTVTAGDTISYSVSLRANKGECRWINNSPAAKILIQQGL